MNYTSARRLAAYFVCGGTIVTVATYFGGQGEGLIAAFLVMFPSISVVSISTVYHAGGASSALSFVKGLILLLPAWLVYAIVILYLLPRTGLPLSLTIGISIYVFSCFLLSRLSRIWVVRREG